ncbi:DUF2213 domain-containing protein [Campylobacter jejuni]|uniref:DUF2213 domain-containing protein n=1 Tax=Campylobacter jejuni TaxID=197 RepID=UPI00073DE382|nr:DUF2213 domain-containing protein [Campylobacter jejuni]ALW15618.1 hypothetical protein RC26_02695 [Campylobacter jejuni]
MLTLKIEDKQLSQRSKDDNGFLIIKNNPIAKAGVFDYLLSEVAENISDNDDKIVKVYRSFEDLVKIKDSFANKPIKFNHLWVGEDDNKADGAIGSIVTIDKENLMLRADLIIYNPELINAIENQNLVELSPGYTGEISEQNGRFNGDNYDYIQTIKCVNHLAVVDKGRSGPDLKIQDSKNKIMEEIDKMKKKFKDSLLSTFKKILDEDATMEKETQDEDLETKTQDEDKRDIIREIMAIANKPAEDFEGGEEERERTIAELAEKLAYNPSETSKTDDDIEEVEKKEDEDIVEVLEKEDDNNAEELAEVISDVVEKVVEKKLNDFEDRMFKKSQKIADTYSKVSKALGYTFDYSGKTENDLYKYGYENLTGKKLDKYMDAKTAFNIAFNDTKSKVKTFQDNSTILNDNKIKSMIDTLRKRG